MENFISVNLLTRQDIKKERGETARDVLTTCNVIQSYRCLVMMDTKFIKFLCHQNLILTEMKASNSTQTISQIFKSIQYCKSNTV